MTKATIAALAFLLAAFAFSQENIDSDFAQELQKSFSVDKEGHTLMNAMQKNSVKEMIRDEEIMRKHNKYFTYEIKTGKVTDQKSTGRCWLYAMLNTIRPSAVKKIQRDDFEFSQTYLYFWDKMEKANTFLEKAITRADLDIRDRAFRRFLSYPTDDGGYWQNGADLVKKYGCVPLEIMPDVVSTASSREMNRIIGYQLRYFAYELKQMKDNGKTVDELRARKREQLKAVYRMLAFHLGEPVQTFQFRHFSIDPDGKKVLTPYKVYTPKSFAQEFVEENLDDYLMFANWPARDYYKNYRWQSSNNLVEGTPLSFVNLPMEEIKKMMKDSIIGGDPVNFSADVGKQSDRKNGIMVAGLYPYQNLYGVPFNYDKRINTLIGNINSTHAMVILGMDICRDKVIKWKVENSWGTDDGDQGAFYMYDNWVDLYVVRVVIRKKYIPQDVLALFSQEQIEIPEDQPEQ